MEFTLLSFQLSTLLSKVARIATESCHTVAASTTSDLVAPADRRACADLEDPSETTGCSQSAVKETIATTSTASMLGVWLPAALQMIKTLLDLLIDNARAESRDATRAAVTEAVQKTVAPFAFAIRVICVSRTIRVHGLLRCRLLLVALRRGTLFLWDETRLLVGHLWLLDAH